MITIKRSDDHEHEIQCDECHRFVPPGQYINHVELEGDTAAQAAMDGEAIERMLCSGCLAWEINAA